MKVVLNFKIFVVLLCSCLTSAAFSQNDSFDNLDNFVGQAMQDWGTPGVAIGIVRNDSVLLAKGFGVKKLGSNNKVDAHTLFAVASNSKAFTAALIGTMVDNGKLRWDDRVVDHLSDFQMFDPYVTRELNLKDLMTHRSGLPLYGGDRLWIGGGKSREHIVHQVRYLQPNAPFRTKFQYNNLMWLVAGQVYAAVAGHSWDDGIKSRIFQPLGMGESLTSITELAGKNYATPHEAMNGKVRPIDYDNVDSVGPAAGINSNVLDMIKWMRLNLGNGTFEGKQILSRLVSAEIHTAQIPTRITNFNKEKLNMRFASYGLGYGIQEFKGYKMVRHSGGLSGMISLQVLIPEKNIGVVVLTNRAPNTLPWVIAYTILEQMLGFSQTDWNAEFLALREKGGMAKEAKAQKLLSERSRGTKPSLSLSAYTGDYFEDFSGPAKMKIKDGKLVFNYKPRYVADLEHWHFDTFRVMWRNPIYDMPAESFANFQLNENGNVSKVTITFYEPVTFVKK